MNRVMSQARRMLRQAVRTVTPAATMAPANRARIRDNLLPLLDAAQGKTPIAVIVQLTQHREISDVQAEIGPFTVKYEYNSFPAFAADMSKDQVDDLATRSWVKSIEHDASISACLDTSTKWSGVQQARADFGVSGDHDKNDGGYTKTDIVIAVIDTGIDATHVDLQNKVIGWKDLIGSRGTPYDDHGHGTHCSSIAAGAGVGDPRYKGVAPGAALVGVKVLDQNGSGTLSGVAAGVDWVVTNKDTYNVRVISMSLGTSSPSDGNDTVSVAVNHAVDAGIVCVVAAGNSGPAAGTVGSPAAAVKAITLGATDGYCAVG